jgi:hypothetical protein
METKDQKTTENNHSQHPLLIMGEYSARVQKIIDALYKTPRNCWTKSGVEDPETVGECTDKCVALAEEFFSIPGLAIMIKVSNWHKVNREFNQHQTDGVDWTEFEKRAAADKIMQKICVGLGPHKEVIYNLWSEYQDQKTTRSKTAADIKRFHTIMTAIKYQEAGQPVSAFKFIDDAGQRIQNVVIRRKFFDKIISK